MVVPSVAAPSVAPVAPGPEPAKAPSEEEKAVKKEVDEPAAPADKSVLLDTVPPGASVIVEGKVIATTPEDVSVKAGSTLTVQLAKAGFVEKAVVLDPTVNRKLLVRLEHRKDPRHAASTKAPAAARPAAADGKAAKKAPVDPYERLDDAPKKSSDVLNPY
jgi:hypothetical protein